MTFLSIALIWMTGFGLARLLFPAPPRWSLATVFLFSLGTGLGAGIASILYFAGLAVAGPSSLVLAGLLVIAAASIFSGARSKSRGATLDWAGGPATPRYLTVLLYLAIAIAAATFLVYALEKPQGEWDAWSTWNLKARFLFRGGDFWKEALSGQTSNLHPDYPLLLPSVIALCWTIARSESSSVPIAVAFLFTLGVCGLLISAIGVLWGKTQAWLAGILLLATSAFIQLGAMQYADLPMSFYILATLALLCLQDRFPDDLRFSIAAGLTAGFAPWTKNEGWVFLIAVLIGRTAAILRYGNRAWLIPQLFRFAGAALPPVALAAFFKLSITPRNDLFTQKFSDLMGHIATFGRWVLAAEGLVKMLVRLGGFLVPIVLVLGLYWFLVRFRVEAGDRQPVATLLFTLGLTLAGEFFAYVALPPDIFTEINTSMERLFNQLWPAAILAFFLAANPPQLVTRSGASDAKSKPGQRSPNPKRRAGPSKPAHPPVRLN